jgi:hypothetical protein
MKQPYPTNPQETKFSKAKRVSLWIREPKPAPRGLDTSHKLNKVENHPQKPVRIGQKAERYYKDAERKETVISSLLEYGDYKARSVGVQVKACKAFISIKNGEAQAHIRYCNKRECPMCSRREQSRRRNDLLKVIEGLSSSGEMKYSFITLTMDRKRLDDVSCSNTFSVFRNKLSQFLNRPEYRKAQEGTYYTIEATKNETWNIHAHLLVEHRGSRRDIKRLVYQLWNNSLNVGSIIKVKKFHINKKSICELVKYVVKDYSLTGKEFATFCSVIHGRRLTGASGTIRRGLKSERDKRKVRDDIVIPAPPRKPDMVKLRDGRYGLEQIYTMAINCEPLGIYLFRLLEYRAKWGYKYEEVGLGVGEKQVIPQE